MPELQFKGKEFVFNHHLSVPYRPLIPHPDKSMGDVQENLIVHGDNLHALKALLPQYAGKVDCIFIDPPYNTGTEGWSYNDNVNSPLMREWLDGNPVNKEDMLRHDKWCCMMYPRLKLLHELLAETGSFWMTIDNNEIENSLGMLKEIFGEKNHIQTLSWQKKYTRSNDANGFSLNHDYIIAFAKNDDLLTINLEGRTAKQESAYSNPNEHPKGPWKATPLHAKSGTDKKFKYEFKNGVSWSPPDGTFPRFSKGALEKFDRNDEIWFGEDGNSIPSRMTFLCDVKEGVVPTTLWLHSEAGNTHEANTELMEILGRGEFENPKPTKLIQKILRLATSENSLILDSFSGSGTTGHAVMKLNSEDDGQRNFILIECEEYADRVTAERVRRVIKGFEFKGVKKEELFREKITWTKLQKANDLLHEIEGIKTIEEFRFDNFTNIVKDGYLIVTGEKKITKKVEGIGRGFSYKTLGEPLNIDKILTGKTLPPYSEIGAWLFHTATGATLNQKGVDKKSWYLGESEAFHCWLIYKPDVKWLKSNEAVLTESQAKIFAKAKKRKRHLVFAPSRFVSNKVLSPLGVEYSPLPFALYRVERG